MSVGRFLLRTSHLNTTCVASSIRIVTVALISRNAFTATKPDPFRPNMLRVGLTFGSTALLWALLFKQHSMDVQEYKTRNGLL